MLSFIFTDADIAPNLLRMLLKKTVASTFNAITVDSDQSTNDMVTIFSTKKIKIGQNRTVLDPIMQKFEMALKNLCLNLAKQIVVDGEGAKKFVTINVINAKSLGSAKNIAFSIANSPLVKTAIAGEDPNWGRIAMALGKAGVKIDLQKLMIQIGQFKIIEKGQLSEKYNEDEVASYMKEEKIDLTIDIETGSKSFTAYTMDLTKKYIEINSDYRS